MKLSEHFDSTEFECHCGCGFGNNEGDVHPDLVERLETLRAIAGVPLRINSGCRCPAHNADVGGVPNSQHVFGTAADIELPWGYDVDELVEYAEEAGFDGIGAYDWGIHVDVRGYLARWDNRGE